MNASPQQDGFENEFPESKRRVGVIALAFLIYFQVSGGPFGTEAIISSGGPLIGIILTCLFPWLWCLPLSLLFAELFSTFPSDGSSIQWVSLAFGKPWGFQLGFWSWIAGVTDNALYPCLFVDTMMALVTKSEYEIPQVWFVLIRALLAIAFMLPALLNSKLVGWTLFVFAIIIVLPFLVMVLFAIPQIDSSNWLVIRDEIDWSPLLSTLFWNYSGFDGAGSFAGEVKNPKKTFPRAMILCIFLITISYLIPFLAICGVNKPVYTTWEEGSYSLITEHIAGRYVSVWLIIASFFGNLGMYVAEMTKDAFLLAGMADLRFAPRFFSSRHPTSGTPVNAITLSVGIIMIVGIFDFNTILGFTNFFNCLSTLAQMAASIRLRFTHPNLSRPYRVPLSNYSIIIWLIFPTIIGSFVLYNEFFKSWTTLLLNSISLAFGFFICILWRYSPNYTYLSTSSDEQFSPLKLELENLQGEWNTIVLKDEMEKEDSKLNESLDNRSTKENDHHKSENIDQEMVNIEMNDDVINEEISVDTLEEENLTILFNKIIHSVVTVPSNEGSLRKRLSPMSQKQLNLKSNLGMMKDEYKSHSPNMKGATSEMMYKLKAQSSLSSINAGDIQEEIEIDHEYDRSSAFNEE